jgi:hypothetical protein
VTSYRGGNRNENIFKMFQEFKNKFGYKTDKEIPKEWYFEKENNIKSIRDIAAFVRAEKQYDEDYKHLSGIEHSDITAAIVESFELSRESLYGYLILLKSVHILGIMINFGMTIVGDKTGNEILSILKEINIISADFYAKINVE